MAMITHPITGVLINEIETHTGPISEKERDTARLLLQEGHARWVVAAMLGRFPLAFSNTGGKTERLRTKIGSNLTARDAASDPRQTSMMDEFDRSFDEMFGTQPR